MLSHEAQQHKLHISSPSVPIFHDRDMRRRRGLSTEGFNFTMTRSGSTITTSLPIEVPCDDRDMYNPFDCQKEDKKEDPYTGLQKDDNPHSLTDEKYKKKAHKRRRISNFLYSVVTFSWLFYISKVIIYGRGKDERREDVDSEGDGEDEDEGLIPYSLRKAKQTGGDAESLSLKRAEGNFIAKRMKYIWKHRRQYYKSIILCVVVGALLYITGFYCLRLLNVKLQPRGYSGPYEDEFGRKSLNCLAHIQELTRQNELDCVVVDYINNKDKSGVFAPATKQDIRRGFKSTRMPIPRFDLSYELLERNISYLALYMEMVESSLLWRGPLVGKRSPQKACQCAAYYGIPLNVVLTVDSHLLERDKQTNQLVFKAGHRRLREENILLEKKAFLDSAADVLESTDTRRVANSRTFKRVFGHPELLFMIDPHVRSGSNIKIKATTKDVLMDSPTKVQVPKAINVDYYDILGTKRSARLFGESSLCVIRCVQLAIKEPIVSKSPMGGIEEYKIVDF